MSEVNQRWYYRKGGIESGPVTIDELQSLIRSGGTEELLVWREGLSEWAIARELEEFSSLFPPRSVDADPRNEPQPVRSYPGDGGMGGRSEEIHERLSDKTGVSADSLYQPKPWRRFFARWIDLFVFMPIFTVAMGLLWPDSLDDQRFDRAWPVLVSLAYVPFEALLLIVFGSTIGKWLYKIELVSKDGKMSWAQCLDRSFRVLVFGQALSVYLLNLIAFYRAEKDLTSTGSTSWDRAVNVAVKHHPIGMWRWLTIILLYSLLISLQGLTIILLLVEKVQGG